MANDFEEYLELKGEINELKKELKEEKKARLKLLEWMSEEMTAEDREAFIKEYL